MTPFRRDPNVPFKIITAVIIIFVYLIIQLFRKPTWVEHLSETYKQSHGKGSKIQFQGWKGGYVPADEEKVSRVVEAMKFTFTKYREKAWGYDDIKPISGTYVTTRNGWGNFIVDSSTTLALMGLWDELRLEVEHIIEKIDFNVAHDLVDPFETTIRYLGGLLSLVDLIDARIIPESIVSRAERNRILEQAVTLADRLGPSYDSPTGLPWPKVDFNIGKGVQDLVENQENPATQNPAINAARAGSTILEARTLSRLTSNPIYLANSTKAWAPLVWPKYISETAGLVSGPLDIVTGEPMGSSRHWDAIHGGYYEDLLKISMLAPKDRYTPVYQDHWLAAATALRYSLTTRSNPSKDHPKQHLFMGKLNGNWYLNTQSHLACFAPGNILLGARYLAQLHLIPLGQALLEACHHTYESTPTGIGPETFSWSPGLKRTGAVNSAFTPTTPRQSAELDAHGFWSVDASYHLRPEYIESLFYAWRITGEQRYRDWAWDAFLAIEKHCKAEFGYASLRNVGATDDSVEQEDESESFWASETLKYFWMIFQDTERISLDRWVFTTGGHPLRMIR